MQKVTVAGASGNIGRSILQELKLRGYHVRALVRSKAKAQLVRHSCDEVTIVDPLKAVSLAEALSGTDILISALGKSLSLQDRNTLSFWDIDYAGNVNLLKAALACGVEKFIYVSAFNGERFMHLEYFKAHEYFSKVLAQSGINYTVVKPPAVFAALLDMVDLAARGKMVSIGNGKSMTNPIYEGDLAKICADAITSSQKVIEVGGKKIYTRLELAQLACQAAGQSMKVPKVPFWLVQSVLALVRLFSMSLYDKVALYVAVSKADCVAPQVGEYTLEEYFASKVRSTLFKAQAVQVS